MSEASDTPLLAWQPPRQVIPFPLASRTGRIRDVAMKMMDKPTDRSAAHYRNQVTEALILQMEKIGLPENEQDEQLGEFWERVQAEMIRLTYSGHRTGGDPA